ncbi:MAG: energy transducer TonB [Bacteroidales bacterium]|nr:energy transducer TonB [Bacteroidales bacterium]
MKEQNTEKKFIDLPEYPGGKKALQEFIRTNLKYPKEALEKRIEGTVHVKYRVDGLGKVISAEVTHGIGYGCDEEALRVVRAMKYGRAKNRGVRVTASMRTKITFKLAETATIKYNYVAGKKNTETSKKQEPKKDGGTYGYTISF